MQAFVLLIATFSYREPKTKAEALGALYTLTLPVRAFS